MGQTSSKAPRREAPILTKTGTGGARPYGGAWLITFTDLVALMLTFFVLLFSMSQIEQPRWQNLVDAFSKRLDKPHEVKIAVPVAELDVEPEERIPATDLGYLDPILREKLLTQERLAAARLWRLGDRITLSLPASQVFTAGSSRFAEEGEALVFALSGLLQQIDNRIEIVAYSLTGDAADAAVAAADLSLLRALAVADTLKRAGYAAELATLGHGASGRLPGDLSLAERASLEERVEIVVFSDRAS